MNRLTSKYLVHLAFAALPFTLACDVGDDLAVADVDVSGSASGASSDPGAGAAACRAADEGLGAARWGLLPLLVLLLLLRRVDAALAWGMGGDSSGKYGC